MIGGKFIATPDTKKKKQNGKVVKIEDHMYSVHTNQVYRTVCHVPPGMFWIWTPYPYVVHALKMSSFVFNMLKMFLVSLKYLFKA